MHQLFTLQERLNASRLNNSARLRNYTHFVCIMWRAEKGTVGAHGIASIHQIFKSLGAVTYL